MTDVIRHPEIRTTTAVTAAPDSGATAPVIADPRDLRNALGSFATGVVVVTYSSGGTRYGVTVNSFTSVSLDPPLVLVSMKRTSRALPCLMELPFTVNVLGEDQLATALQFAGKPQPDHQVDWVDDDHAPRINGSVAHFQCTPWAGHDGGDHVLVLGRVLDYRHHGDGNPLVFHRGQWRALAEEHTPSAGG